MNSILESVFECLVNFESPIGLRVDCLQLLLRLLPAVAHVLESEENVRTTLDILEFSLAIYETKAVAY